MEPFDVNDIFSSLNVSPLYAKCIGAYICSIVVSFVALPKIIRVSYRKQLMDIPKGRSSHARKTPNLGGIAIFFALIFSLPIFTTSIFSKYIFFIPALAILFFIGLMDDLLIVSPRKKLLAQLTSALMVVVGSDVRITGFFGIMGIYELPYIVSVCFTVFVFIIILNSYNLIDGIDGLASGVGLVSSMGYVYVFFRLYQYDLGITSVILMAALLAFLRFNLSKYYKIFMGDTGSMVVGFVLTFLTIEFLNVAGQDWVSIASAPAIAIALMIVPISDTLSVIIIRLIQKKSPVKPDKNHMHHRFINLGLSHIQTSTIICAFNAGIILLTYQIRHLNVNIILAIILSLSLLISLAPYFLKKYSKNKLQSG